MQNNLCIMSDQYPTYGMGGKHLFRPGDSSAPTSEGENTPRVSCYRAGGCLPEQDGGYGEYPPLRISLFGGFEVSRELYPFDLNSLNRSKVRNLLSIMALCPGRDLDCSHAARVIWPEGSDGKNRHNFYNLWSLLRQGLQLPDGTCPYIVRRQNSCRLVDEIVFSDVVELDNLCSRLQFDCATVDEMMETFRAICKVYAGDLLPGEDANAIITRKRWEWRNRLVDAFMVASNSLYFCGEYNPALWIAQKASVVDPTREDVCITLMQAYAATGAKSAALSAFYALVRSLKDEVAVDPSEQVTDFYNAILNDDWETQESIISRQMHLTTYSPLQAFRDTRVSGVYRGGAEKLVRPAGEE